MSDPRPERRVNLGQRSVTLRYDMNALADLEQALGVTGMTELSARLADAGFATIRAFVWAAVRHEHPEATPREVGSWMSMSRLVTVTERVAEAVAAAMPSDDGEDDGGDRDRGEADPTERTG